RVLAHCRLWFARWVLPPDHRSDLQFRLRLPIDGRRRIPRLRIDGLRTFPKPLSPRIIDSQYHRFKSSYLDISIRLYMIKFDYFIEIALTYPPQRRISGKSAEARRQLPYPEPCSGGFHTGGHEERFVSISFSFTWLIRASSFLPRFSKNVAILLQVAAHLLQLAKGLIVSQPGDSGIRLAHTSKRMDRAAKSASAKSLYDFPVHSNLRIRLISGNWEVRRSFNQLGLFEGDRVRVVWKAPFGGRVILEAR